MHALAKARGVAERGGEMRFANARRPEQQNVRVLIEPTVTFGQSGDAGFADRGDGGEVEPVEGLARGQSGLQQMPGCPPPRPLGDLVLHQRREGLRRGPALAVGGFGQRRPEPGDRGQTKLGEQHR
jgi:hypothetical protein